MNKEHKKESKNKDDNMNNNFLLVSLDEKKGKKVAEAINNDTARKILDALAKKEYTESELSKVLSIPISTIHYNLKQLMEANLVLVDEFHYSSKGKEVNHYKLANKYIIIAPKSDDSRFIEALKKIIPISTITALTGAGLLLYRFIENKLLMTATPEVAPMMMKTAEDSAAGASMVADTMMMQTTEIARPFLQSEMIAWFLIGALSVTIIYFVYELVKKK